MVSKTPQKLRFVLSGDVLPSNCCVGVVSEFHNGHNTFADHPTPLSDNQWMAVLKQAEVTERLVVFSGRIDQKQYNVSPSKLASFFRRMGQKVQVVQTDQHVVYTVKTTPAFRTKLLRFNIKPHFKWNDWGTVDVSYGS